MQCSFVSTDLPQGYTTRTSRQQVEVGTHQYVFFRAGPNSISGWISDSRCRIGTAVPWRAARVCAPLNETIAQVKIKLKIKLSKGDRCGEAWRAPMEGQLKLSITKRYRNGRAVHSVPKQNPPVCIFLCRLRLELCVNRIWQSSHL